VQHFAQCELLPRGEEVGDASLAQQFAGAGAHASSS
jgi:hypothetical protein